MTERDKSYVLQIRLSSKERANLLSAIEQMNDELEFEGRPRAITITNLVRLRIRDLLQGGSTPQAEPESPAERRVVSSAGIDAARAALRGKR